MMAEPIPETATDALVVAARTDREAFGRLYDIYGNLTVREENEAPDVSGAERIGAFSGPSKK